MNTKFWNIFTSQIDHKYSLVYVPLNEHLYKLDIKVIGILDSCKSYRSSLSGEKHMAGACIQIKS